MSNNIEYLHKRFRYFLPSESEIYLSGKVLKVIVDDKKLIKLTPYLSESPFIKSKMKVGLPITYLGSKVYLEYKSFINNLNKKNKFTYFEFDYLTSHELILCTFFKSKDFQGFELLLREINKTLPYILNIFERPLIHLKETNVVNQVDTVKRIDYKTINHLGMHPENIYDIKNKFIRPNKLLTRIYVDDYGIYENIVFKNLIDMITSFLEKRNFLLKDALEIFNQSLRIDDVTYFNHPKYFLAIGKLYLGFSSIEDHLKATKIVDNTSNLLQLIKTNKNKDVYKKNALSKVVINEARQTNILLLHKDYKHIYSLFQKFTKVMYTNEDGNQEEQKLSQKYYCEYVKILFLFAITNFNFTNNKVIYNDGLIDNTYTFKDYKLILKSVVSKVIGQEVISCKISEAENSYKLLIIPLTYYFQFDKKKTIEYLISRLQLEFKDYTKFVFVEPFLNDPSYDYHCFSDVMYGVIPVSISDINSFRRLQKIVFEGLVNVSQLKYCCYCGEAIVNGVCSKCLMQYKSIECSCKQSFRATNCVNKLKDKSSINNFYKQEKLYMFKNVTNMKNNNFVCLYCNQEIK